MLVAICSDKGAPGCTTAALALASAWPAPAVVVEADLAGGDLGLRLRTGNGTALPETPTVLTVATAARTQPSMDLVGQYAHHFTDLVGVIPGAAFGEQTRGVNDWVPLAGVLATTDLPVFVDLGATGSTSPLLPIAACADVVIVVGRSVPGSVLRMRERLSRLALQLGAMRGAPPRLFPLLVTPSRHGVSHLADLRSILGSTAAKPFLVGAGYIAYDPEAVRRLECAEQPSGRLARTALMRSARTVVSTLEQIGEAAAKRTAPDSIVGGRR